jgi:Carboxypeptidase regulatory-like domain
MKTILIIASVCLSGMSFAQNTFGDIIGTYTEKDLKSGIPGVTVVTTRGEQVFKAITNDEGRFRMSGVPAGEYKIYFIEEGDTVFAPEPVDVAPDGIGDLGAISRSMVSKEIDPVVIIAPILQLKRGVAPEIKLTKKDIVHMPIKFDAKKMVASMTTDVRMTDDGELVFRGARKGDLINYIDGVKMTDVQNVPSSALGYIMVYAGAIPAKYGDTTGGVVVMETLSYFDLLREWEAKQ